MQEIEGTGKKFEGKWKQVRFEGSEKEIVKELGRKPESRVKESRKEI